MKDTNCDLLAGSHSILNWSKNYARFEVIHGGDYEELRPLGCYAVWLL
jgi:hypothetical protein